MSDTAMTSNPGGTAADLRAAAESQTMYRAGRTSFGSGDDIDLPS